MTAADDVPTGSAPLYYHRTKVQVQQGHDVSVIHRNRNGGSSHGVVATIAPGEPGEWQITYQSKDDEVGQTVTIRQTDHVRYYGLLT